MKFGKIITTNLSDQDLGDKYLQLPVGSTRHRPQSPEDGMLRYNLDAGGIEGFSRDKWTDFLTTADFRIPGVSLPEDENVTIASLATLLRQFQRTITGGFDVLGVGVSSPDDTTLSPQTITVGNPGVDELSWITNVERGEVRGWLDESGKGENFASAKCISTGSWFSSFETIIDPYAMSKFDEQDRHNYIFDYFANVYRYSYISGDYVNRGANVNITPAWDLLDPWVDPAYGKFRVHVSVLGPGTHAGYCFMKWYVKLVRFRNFRLQNVPELVPGGGSEPMPDIVDIVVDGTDYNELNLQNYLLRKYPTWAQTPVTVYIHVKPNQAIYSRNSNAAALDTTGLPPGSKVYVKNEGWILGSGGKGGAGGGYVSTGASLTMESAEDGQTGGTALKTDTSVSLYLDNIAGDIYGGGGGGGGGMAVPLLPTHSGTYLSHMGGGGGGAGGAEQVMVGNGGFGAGFTEPNLNDPTQKMLVSTTLQGATTIGSTHRDSGGINIDGINGGEGGSTLVSKLSGGTGGTGGESGQAGGDGETITQTPNVMVIGWTASDQISANQKITFGTEDITMGSIAGFDPNDSSQNDWSWFNTNVIPALNVDNGATYDILPFQSKTFYETFTGVVNAVPLVFGFVVRSVNAGPGANSWSGVSITGDGTVIVPWTDARGAADLTETGGAGGEPGFCIVGDSTINYSIIDVAARSATASTNKGTRVGRILA
jgi:hypothetical protein